MSSMTPMIRSYQPNCWHDLSIASPYHFKSLISVAARIFENTKKMLQLDDLLLYLLLCGWNFACENLPNRIASDCF